jgi:hypothetical protein
MYGLPQAGIISQQQLLEDWLEKHRYPQSKVTPGLWSHNTRPISFTLVVNDFEVKYVGKEHAQHLLNTVQQFYKCSCDWKGERYIGLTIKWDYKGQNVHLSMPNYVAKALRRFRHPPPTKLKHQPYPHVRPTYGATTQYAKEEDQSQPLDKAGKKYIQEVCGVFLYLARSVDGRILPALSSLESQQANPTKNTMILCNKLLNYMASQDKAILTCQGNPQRRIIPIRSERKK